MMNQRRTGRPRTRMAASVLLFCLLAVPAWAGWQLDLMELMVPPYRLPPALVASDGTAVTTADLWQTKRRPELLELFRHEVYGRAPGRPAAMTFTVFDQDREARGGKAIRKQVRIDFNGDASGPGEDLLIYLPNTGKSAPVFLILNAIGNQSVDPDPAIRVSPYRAADEDLRMKAEHSRGAKASRFPVDELLARGYGLATIDYEEIDPDFDDGFKNGVQGYFDQWPAGERPGDAWGSISAWAWGLSRAVDYLVTDPDVDHSRIMVAGHSRRGKTSLWAGAQDERIALVISNESGCGGAALSRRHVGETLTLINVHFPHWFCKNFHRYNERENQLPIDQHELIDLIAPRPVYVASAEDDWWSDPRGEYLSAWQAGEVYALFGEKGLPSADLPPVETPLQDGAIGYHIRTGGHDLTSYDWQRYMDFADRRLGAAGN